MNDQLRQAIIDGNESVATAMTSALLASGATAREILDAALLPGMEVVGADGYGANAGMAVERAKELVG